MIYEHGKKNGRPAFPRRSIVLSTSRGRRTCLSMAQVLPFAERNDETFAERKATEDETFAERKATEGEKAELRGRLGRKRRGLESGRHCLGRRAENDAALQTIHCVIGAPIDGCGQLSEQLSVLSWGVKSPWRPAHQAKTGGEAAKITRPHCTPCIALQAVRPPP